LEDDLEILKREVLQCRRCGLALTRNNVIFGEGNSKAPVMIIGEAPGRDEDLQGRPFVGLSGQLLDKRLPTQPEAKVCMPWLLRQIEIINPKIIVLLGSTALKYMAGTEWKITRDHGKWISCQFRLAMPVYHPAALLRDPSLKRDTWDDFKKIVLKYRELVDRNHYSRYI
jgi:uracil-DNA glycosylase